MISIHLHFFSFQGTPFIAKSYDATKVAVGSVIKGIVGRNVQFTVDAGDAGEGNLEITISAKGHNIPTQVHPQGNAKYKNKFIFKKKNRSFNNLFLFFFSISFTKDSLFLSYLLRHAIT